ncbi:hypothetical protein [Desulfurivibrio sp. C05AmB]|uniref:hypothetical protein n=1 Tax=Desulfurivibrio sp. C05AmB TaxID=3374371 RepID=UPI00376EF228
MAKHHKRPSSCELLVVVMDRGKKKSRKMQPGTWLERDLFTSPAFLELGGFAPQLLILFLGKRDIDPNTKVVVNRDNITMTFIELEQFYERREKQLKDQGSGTLAPLPKGGIKRPRITRALDQLLAHGFIRIIRRGGAYKKDKTIYGLTEDWRFWRPGTVIRSREPDTRRLGYNGRKTKIAHENVPIHTHENVPIEEGLG